MRGFRTGTKASRATVFINSAAVIWYRVLFRQNRTNRPGACGKKEEGGPLLQIANVQGWWRTCGSWVAPLKSVATQLIVATGEQEGNSPSTFDSAEAKVVLVTG